MEAKLTRPTKFSTLCITEQTFPKGPLNFVLDV